MDTKHINAQIVVEGPYAIEGTDDNVRFPVYRVTGPGLINEGWTGEPTVAIHRARQYNNIWNEARRTSPLPVSIQEAMNSGDGTYRP